MEFHLQNLVYRVESDLQNPIKCILCQFGFKDLTMTPIKQHYKQSHGYQFRTGRKRKCPEPTDSEADSPQMQPSCTSTATPFPSADHFITNCVKQHVQLNMSYNQWDLECVRISNAPLEEMFNVSVNGQKMREHVEEASVRISMLIRERFANRPVSLKFDIGSRNNRPFLSVAVQYLIDFEVKVTHLGIFDMNKKPKSIQKHIRNMMSSFGINQIYGVTTDHVKNLNRESGFISETDEFGLDSYIAQESDTDFNFIEQITEELEKPNFLDVEITPTRGAAHLVHLAINDWLKLHLPEEILAKFKEASIKMQEKIRNSRDSWSSIYCMLEGLLNARSEMDSELPPELWNLAVEISQSLDAIKQLTTNLQKVQYVCGDLLMDIIWCEVRLAAINTTRASTLLSALKVQKASLIDNIQFLACLYLDPRFNNSNRFGLLSEQQKEKALRYLLELHERMSKKHLNSPSEPIPDSNASSGGDSPTASAVLSNAELFLTEVFGKSSEERKVAMPSLRQRLMAFEVRFSPIMDGFDIGQFWKELAKIDPELGELASVVLSTPVSRVSVERIYQSLPQIITALGAFQSIPIKHLLNVKLNVHEL